MNVAIILAGGTKCINDNGVPTQFTDVAGEMLLTHCLRPFGESELVDNIQIVASEKWREKIEFEMFEDPDSVVGEKFLGFSSPGENRQASIWNAMKDLRNIFDCASENDASANVSADTRENSDYSRYMAHSRLTGIDGIIIHDSLRPFVTVEGIDECLRALDGHDGVMPVIPEKDTVYFSRSGDKVEELLNRNCIYAGQAPVAFLFNKYYVANEELLPERMLMVKSYAEPAIMAGLDVAMIPGDQRNFKILTGEDFERAKEILQRHDG